jgi:hypothetical protein
VYLCPQCFSERGDVTIYRIMNRGILAPAGGQNGKDGKKNKKFF